MKKKIKVPYAIPFSIIFAFLISGCTTGYYYDLSSRELARLKLDAVRGDGGAAHRISQYYRYTREDYNNTFIWTLIGAENGYRRSMDDLTAFYFGGYRIDEKCPMRAIFWLYQLAVSNDLDTEGYWRQETFIKQLENEGYTLETARPPGDSLFPPVSSLSGSDLTRYEEGALQGSGQAALVLANHYNNTGEAESAEYWYRIGAQNGTTECQEQYGNILMGKSENLDRERGKFWLARANVGW